jgi:predicted dehydrogenase
VLVEKPMCFTLREADEMIAVAAEHDVRLMVAYMKRYDPGYLLAQQAVRRLRHPRAVEVHIWHPLEWLYMAHHRIDRANDVPHEVLGRLRAEYDALVREAIGAVPDWLGYAYAEVLLGSIIHDINALRGLIGAPDAIMSTEIWAQGNAIMSTFRYGQDVRAVLTWLFLDDVSNYREDLAFLATDGRVEIRFPSPFLKSVPTPVVVEQMEDGVYTRREHCVSFEEAFKQELLHFHQCVTTGAHPLTDGAEGKADVALAIAMFNAFRQG